MIDPIADQSVTDDATLDVAVAASDPDGDTLVLSETGTPTFGTFTDHGDGTATFTFNPAPGDAGTYDITVTVTATDPDCATDTGTYTLTVQAEAGSDGITLEVSTYKVRGVKHADLTWSGATSTDVDVYRDGTLVTTTANDGAYTDGPLGRGSGSATYQVCEAGTQTCSDEISVSW